jgi:hypothetical protein
MAPTLLAVAIVINVVMAVNGTPPVKSRRMGERLTSELHVAPDGLPDATPAVTAPPAAEPRL